MLSESSIEKINKVLKDRTFNYTGNLLHDIVCDIDFKIELLGYRNMIRVGTEYPYMRVKIIFTKFKDEISKLIFGKMKNAGGNNVFSFITKNSLSMRRGLENYLSSVFQFFDPENYTNVVIDDIEITHDFEEETFITEQKKSREATRQVVRDIINTIAGSDSSLRNGLADIDNMWNKAYLTYVKNDTMITLMERLNCDMSKMTFAKKEITPVNKYIDLQQKMKEKYGA
jgi:hypothetical protein